MSLARIGRKSSRVSLTAGHAVAYDRQVRCGSTCLGCLVHRQKRVGSCCYTSIASECQSLTGVAKP